MKFKSAIITSASGSIGGNTFSRNAGGMYIRSRAMPTNPNTTNQQTVREGFGTISNAWANLTDAQRDGWYVYASNVPLPDRLGDQRNVSGSNQFMRSNAPRLAAGLALVLDAPTDFNIGPTPALTINGLFDDGATDMSVLPGSPGAGGKVLVYIGRPQQNTIRYFRGPYVFAGSTTFAAPGTATVSITDVIPFAVSVGQKVFVRIQTSLDDGRLSADAQSSRTIEAAP